MLDLIFAVLGICLLLVIVVLGILLLKSIGVFKGFDTIAAYLH